MKKSSRMWLFLSFVSAFFVLCLFVSPVQAATYTVININNDGAGSLRAAINAANSTPADDTINFNIPGCEEGGCTVAFTGNPGTAVLKIEPAGSLSIVNQSTVNNIGIAGDSLDRIFEVHSGANLTLIGLSIVQGSALNSATPQNGGGGIFNNGGTVTLIRSTVADNFTQADGGGINSLGGSVSITDSKILRNCSFGAGGGIAGTGAITVTRSSISNNTCSGSGAGIWIGSGSLQVTDSIIAHNDATQGSGIYSDGGIVSITGSTLDNNGYSDGGGYGGAMFILGGSVTISNSNVIRNRSFVGAGIFNNGQLVILNTTIVANVADGGYCAGIYSNSPASMRNTLVADNIAAQNPDVRNFDSFTSLGNNLIGSSQESDVAWQTSDIIDQLPRLGPYGNYGGRHYTFPLASISPAINQGNNCVLTANGCGDNNPAIPTDQRGAVRVGDVDIGAFELNNTMNGGTFRVDTPEGQAYQSFNFELTPDSGDFVYTVSAGSLPPGLMLSNSSAPNNKSFAPQAGPYSISGTPTMGGTFNYTITATKGANRVITNYTTTIQADPTAATVTIGGRVLTTSGRGIFGATVILTNSGGSTRSARTNSFGYYRFDDVAAGASYVFQARHLRYKFAPQVLSVAEEMNDLNFVAAR